MEAGISRDVEGLEDGRGGQIKWIQCATAARLLEVSRQRVYQLCRNGGLASLVYDGRRYVSVTSVNQRVLAMAQKEDG